MKQNVGYTAAISLGENSLRDRDPREVCENTGASWDGETYSLPWLGSVVRLPDGSIEERILWYHYLLGNGPKQPRNSYINYKQVPGAAIYNDNFIKRAIDPMVKAFSGNLEGFLQRGILMGGEKVPLGHMAFTLRALPYLPLTYVVWEGDEEIPANGNILFDETAVDWLCAEDLVVLASLPVYKMLRMKL